MTTIVVDKENLKIYADTQITTNNNTKFNDEKCIFINKNFLFSYSGDYYYYKNFIKEIKKNKEKFKYSNDKNKIIKILENVIKEFNEKNKDFINDIDTEFILLISNKEEDFLLIINNSEIKEINDNFYFSGSGSDYAKLIIKTINNIYQLLDFEEEYSKEANEKFKELIIMQNLRIISDIDIYTNNKIIVYKIDYNYYNDYIDKILNI